MKLSRDWLNDYVDLSDLSDEELGTRFTEIGHAVDSVEKHGRDTVFDLEITTNRVDAMSHLGMARELAAALGKELKTGGQAILPVPDRRDRPSPTAKIRIDAPDMCSRYTGLVIRGVNIKPSTAKVRERLEAVGLRADQQRRRCDELRDAGPRASAARVRSRQARREDDHRPPRQQGREDEEPRRRDA